MDGMSVITALKKKLGLTTDGQLAASLGMSVAAIQLWKKRTAITSQQFAGLVSAAIKKTEVTVASETEANAVKPIVEFFPIDKCLSTKGQRYEMFGVKDGNQPHLYLTGLRAELENHHGVYVFSDSRGHAIYVGKARKQTLWKEMNLAFNRNRKDVQEIMRVKHPERNQAFKTSDEKRRQIRPHAVALHQIASYVSAYKVADGMINELEAMLVRSFANDLLNVRMEHFG